MLTRNDPLLKHHNTAASNPTVTDDADSGYYAGSQWYNTALDALWVCIDPSAGAAVWVMQHYFAEGELVFGASEVVFNEAGADIDLRVEGASNANLLFVDAGLDRVGIGDPSPATLLSVRTADATLYAAGAIALDGIQIYNTDDTAGNGAALRFHARTTGAAEAAITCVAPSASNSELAFQTEASGTIGERMRISSAGVVTVGTGSTSHGLAGAGDLMVSDSLEVDGVAYFDSSLLGVNAYLSNVLEALFWDGVDSQPVTIRTHIGAGYVTALTATTGGLVTIGTGATSHAIAGQGDLLVSDELEVDGMLYLDGNATVAGDGWIGIGAGAERVEFDGTGGIVRVAAADVEISSAAPTLLFTDTNADDFSVAVDGGVMTLTNDNTDPGHFNFSGGHLGLGDNAPTDLHIIIGSEQFTGVNVDAVGIGMFPDFKPSASGANTCSAIKGNMWFGSANWGAGSAVRCLDFYPAPTVVGAAAWGSANLDISAVNTAGLLNVVGRTVTARYITAVALTPITNIFAGRDATSADIVRGVHVSQPVPGGGGSLAGTDGTWGRVTGIDIETMVPAAGGSGGATVAQGIWLHGDDPGADLCFGAGSGDNHDASIYYDGSNLIIDPDGLGAGRVLIGATGDDDMLLNDIEIDGAINHDGSTAGFFGTAPVVKAAALTAALTQITHTGPAATDYAIAAPVNGGWGFSSSNEFETAMSVILNLQTRVDELESRLQAYGLLT